MKTNDPTDKSLFTSSGCLTAESLEGFALDRLTGPDRLLVQDHIDHCEFCKDSVEGLSLWLSQQEKKEGSLVSPAARPTSTYEAGNYTERINKINERLHGRVLVHKETASVRKMRKMPGPYRWIALAASIILFLGIYYVIQMRPLRKDHLALTSKESQIIADSLKQTAETIATTNQTAVQPEKLPQLNRAHSNTISTENDDSESLVVSENIELNDYDIVTENKQPDEIRTPVIAREKETTPEQVKEEIAANESIRTEKKVVDLREMSAPSVSKTKTAAISQDEETVLMVVEEMPEFKGGIAAMHKFILETIQYPENAKESGIQGMVYISFIVETNGMITNSKVLRGIGGGCDEEAQRVISMMPPWIPGKQRGKPVRVQFNLPLEFKLSK